MKKMFALFAKKSDAREIRLNVRLLFEYIRIDMSYANFYIALYPIVADMRFKALADAATEKGLYTSELTAELTRLHTLVMASVLPSTYEEPYFSSEVAYIQHHYLAITTQAHAVLAVLKKELKPWNNVPGFFV